jgi:predicted ester cyclase
MRGHFGQEIAMTAKEIALRFYDPLMTGDVSATAEFMAEDWIDLPEKAGQTPGRAGFAQMVSELRGFFQGLVWSIDDVIVDGDRVVVRSTLRGTPHAHLLGLNVTGHEVAFMAIDIHRVADGRIAQTWHVEDKMAIMKQFGLPHVSFR